MAVDVCNEIPPSLVASPRISFSYDLNHQTDHVGFPLGSSDSSFPTIDFDFDFGIAAQQISSADELFSNGKILPTTQIKKNQETTQQPKSNYEDTKKKRLKEFLFNDDEENGYEVEEEQEKHPLSSSKSFWKFTRSTSLNFDNAKGKGLLRKLQKLSRSNSTGSTPISKQMMPPKILEKQSSQKQQQPPMFRRSNSSSVTTSSSYYQAYNSTKRPPLKTNCRGYGNGIRISPVLNIPPGYGSMSLFGLGSLFCNGKDKKKKK